MTECDPPIEIYWVSGSPFGWRVLLMLEFKGVPYISHRIDTASGEQKSATYLALNPRGKVPTLVHGDVIIAESLAMLTYLERLHPDPPMFGTTALEAARVMQVCSEFVCYLEPVINRLSTAISRNKPLSAAAITARHGTLHQEFGRLNGLLQESNWLAGDMLSAADLTVYPHCKFILRLAARPEAASLSLDLNSFDERYSALAGWMQRFENLSGYDNAYPPHWRENA